MNDAEIPRAGLPPPPEVLAQLIELAKSGYVTGVLKELARLEEAYLDAWRVDRAGACQWREASKPSGSSVLLQAQLDTPSR